MDWLLNPQISVYSGISPTNARRTEWYVITPAVRDSPEIVDKREAAVPTHTHSPVDVFAAIFSPAASLSHATRPTERSSYNAGVTTRAAVKIDVSGNSV